MKFIKIKLIDQAIFIGKINKGSSMKKHKNDKYSLNPLNYSTIIPYWRMNLISRISKIENTLNNNKTIESNMTLSNSVTIMKTSRLKHKS